MFLIKGGLVMQTIFIRFLTQEDRVRGFYELATRARISSLPGEIYQVPIEALRLLEDQHIAYRRAPHAQMKEDPDTGPKPAPPCIITRAPHARRRVPPDD